MSKTVSVVISTLMKRPNDLAKCLEALAKQTIPPDEIIVLKDNFGGVCTTRNYGIGMSGCDIIAFTDDDCIPSPGWIEHIKINFENTPNLCALSGKVYGGLNTTDKKVFFGANMAFDRYILSDFNFDVNFNPQNHEELDLIWTMMDVNEACENGWIFKHDDNVIVHHPNPGGSGVDHWSKARSRNTELLKKKHSVRFAILEKEDRVL